jgi:hypothetical protein
MRVSLVMGVVFCLAPLATLLANSTMAQPTEELQFTPLYPSVVIQNSLLQSNGIGVYVGFGMQGRVAILNSTFVENAEAIRLLGATSLIRGNEFRDNWVGIKIQKELVQGDNIVTFNVAPSQVSFNNFQGNREQSVLNLTSIPQNLNDNFWGDASGPTQGDEQVPEQISPRVAGGFWLLPQTALTVMTVVLGDSAMEFREEMVFSFTVGSFFSEQMIWPIVFIQKTAASAAVKERIQGPALLNSWLKNPAHKGASQK